MRPKRIWNERKKLTEEAPKYGRRCKEMIYVSAYTSIEKKRVQKAGEGRGRQVA